jgi:hypothetical protein
MFPLLPTTFDKTPAALAFEGAQFAQNFYRPGNLDCSQLIIDLISIKLASTNITNGNSSSLIVIDFKKSPHFYKDCGIVFEGELEHEEQPDQIFHGAS